MINVSLSATLTYFLSFFPLPKWVKREIDSSLTFRISTRHCFSNCGENYLTNRALNGYCSYPTTIDPLRDGGQIRA